MGVAKSGRCAHAGWNDELADEGPAARPLVPSAAGPMRMAHHDELRRGSPCASGWISRLCGFLGPSANVCARVPRIYKMAVNSNCNPSPLGLPQAAL